MPNNITITPNRIFDSEKPDVIIMDVVETPLMEKFAEIVTRNGGDILEIGFGLGISADYIYNNKIKSYTCIEIHPEIYQNAVRWAEDKQNVNIILGDWKDIIPTLNNKFDGIFMDTFEYTNYDKFEEYCLNIANVNCILSIFDYTTQPNKSLDFVSVKIDKMEYLNNREDFTIYYSHFNGNSFTKKEKSNSLI